MIQKTELRTILLRISYDGTRFNGWQKQLHKGVETFRTVQGEIEKALAVIHKHPVPLFGSGRTDAGVHARGQAAHFQTDIVRMEAASFIPALNSLLPQDIRITEATHTAGTLHARFSSKERTYRYFLLCRQTAFADELPYCWHIRRTPCMVALNEMAACLKGEQDFTVFAAAGDKSESKCRCIYEAHFFRQASYLVFEITANAFLWKMVRSITGTLLQYEQQQKTAADIRYAVQSKDRRYAGVTAPPQGLFLWSIAYPENLLTPEPL